MPTKKITGATVTPEQPTAEHQQWTPPENIHDLPADHNAPTDHLHNYAQSLMRMPPDKQEEHREFAAKLAANPKLSPETIKEMYTHYAAPTREIHSDVVGNLVNHPNAPAEQIEDYLKRTNDVMSGSRGADRGELGKRPGVSQGLLEDLTSKQIEDPGLSEFKITAHDLRPDYAFRLLANRPAPEPVTGTMTEQQKIHNARVEKMDSIFRHVLINSSHHTPASLQQAVDFLSGDRPVGMSGLGDARKELVANQKNLSARQLEKLYVPNSDDWQVAAANQEIVKHPNVDQTFLSRVALDTVDNGREQREVQEAARQNPSLARQSMEKIVQDAPQATNEWSAPSNERAAHDLLGNPSLTNEDVRKLYEKGYAKALMHDNAPTSLLEKYWNDNGKSTDAARTLLARHTLPESILKDMVNHKNQNVALDALDHKSVNENVLDTAAKRKAPAVADKAAKNPLVAKKFMAERVTSGKMKASEFLLKDENRNAVDQDQMPGFYKTINERYADVSDDNIKKLREDPKDFWQVKAHLAESSELSAPERKENAAQMVGGFLQHVLPEDYRNIDKKPVGQALTRDIKRMAYQGNEAARDALLQRPQLFKGVVDASDPAFDKQYLDKLYNTISEKPVVKVTDSWRGGQLEDLDMASVLHEIAHNPNTSKKLFDKISLKPDFFRNEATYKLDKPEEGTYTVFDRRFRDMPEEKRRENFAKLLEIEGGQKALVTSKQAPKDMWRTAIMTMDEKDRGEFFDRHDVSEYADDTILQDAARGVYNSDPSPSRYGHRFFKPQENAISSFRPGRDDEKLRDALAFIKNGQDRRLSEQAIYEHLDDSYFIGPQKEQYVNMAYAHGSTLGSLALARSVMPEREYDVTPSHGKALDEAIARKFPMGTNGEGGYGDAWLKMLRTYDEQATSSGGNSVKSLLQRAKGNDLRTGDANGNLDFLVDMTSRGVDPDTASAIKSAAIHHGLISNNKMAELAAVDPETFSKTMQSGTARGKAKAIQNLALRDTLPSNMAMAMVPHLANNTFHPDVGSWINRHDRENNEYKIRVMDSFKRGSMNIVNSLISGNRADKVGHVLTGLTDDSENPKRGGLTTVQKRDVVTNVLTNLKTGPYPDDVKNKARLSVYRAMKDANRADLLPKSLMADISRSAIKTNDIELLLQISENPDAPPAAIKQISKLAESPQLLDDQGMERITAMISREGATLPDIKRIYGAAMTRYGQTQNETLKHSLFNNMLDMCAKAGSHDDATDRARFGIGYLKEALSDPDSVYSNTAARHMVHWANSDYLPKEDKKDMFMSVPSTASVDVADTHVSSDIVNDPQIVQSATSGWKLAAFMNDFKKLNHENASAIINRVVNAPDGSLPVPSLDFATNVVYGGNATDEDVVKAVRYAGPAAAIRIVSQANDHFFAANELIGSSMHAILPTVIGDLDESVQGKGDVRNNNYSITHMQEIEKSAASIANAIGQVYGNEDAKVPADRQQLYDDALHQLYDSMDRLHQVSQSINPSLKPLVAKIMFDVAGRSAASNRKHDHEDGGMRALSLVARSRQIISEHNLSPDTNKAEPLHLSTFIRGWTKNSSITSEEDWMNAYKQLPELAYGLDNISGPVPSGAIRQASFPDQYFRDSPNAVMKYMEKLVKRVPEQDRQFCTHKIVDACLKNGAKQDQHAVAEVVREAMDASPDAFTDEYFRKVKTYVEGSAWRTIQEGAIPKGIGGKPFIKSEILAASQDKSSDPQDWENVSGDDVNKLGLIASSPHLDEHDSAFLSGFLNNRRVRADMKHPVAEAIAKNKQVNPNALDAVVKKLDEFKMEMGAEHMRKLTAKIVNNPAVDRKTFFSLYETTKDQYPTIFKAGGKFHPALTNAKYGGDLFRALPQEAPVEVQNIDQSKLVKEFEHSVGKNRIKEAMRLIPPEGIAWAQFKRLMPKAESWPEVKSMFMAKANKPLLPEEAVEEMKRYDGKAFHVTYSLWDGAQRHNRNQKNLVVQLNTSKSMEEQLNRDPKLWNWFQYVQKSANHTHGDQLGGHPVTPHLASWIRVDTTGGQKGWIVEEFQSDFGARLYDQLRQVKQSNPQGGDIDGTHYTVEEMEKYSKQIEEAFESWHEASMTGIEQLAAKQGAENLYIHGEDVRAKLSGMQKSKKNPVWMSRMYLREPPKYGFEKCDYSDYPNKSEGFARELREEGRDTACWRKRLKA